MKLHRRTLIQGLGVTALAALPGAPAAAEAPLTTRVYTSDDKGFSVTSTLIMGEREAILVDSQFSYDHAHRVVADVLETGRTVTQIYVTHGHPDHYFGLAVAKAAFPVAKIVAAPTTIADIERTSGKKIAQWRAQLGANGPTQAIVPEALPKMALQLEGQELSILGPFQGDMPNNTLVWIPSTRTLVAVDTVFSGCYAWTANNSPEQNREWLRTLDRIAELKPDVVIPGHQKAGAPMTMAGVEHTRNYLNFFADVTSSAKGSKEIMAAVRDRYPDLALPVALTLGAKVAAGEMRYE